MASASKPDCAEFAAQRESSMLRSRKSSNPTARLVPESSKHPPLPTKIEEAPPVAEENTETSNVTIDYHATCNSIMTALKQTHGHLTWSAAEKKEAIALIGKPANVTHSILLAIVCATIGAVMCSCTTRRILVK